MGIEGSGLVGGGKTGAADEEAQGLLEEYQGELAKELPGLSGTTLPAFAAEKGDISPYIVPTVIFCHSRVVTTIYCLSLLLPSPISSCYPLRWP